MAMILLFMEDDDVEHKDRCKYGQDGKSGKKNFQAVIMKRPYCGAAALISDVRDLSVAYCRGATVVAGVTGNFCPACGEVVLSREYSDVDAALPS